jgi:hypothetical protein
MKALTASRLPLFLSALAGDPRLFGSALAADAVYALSSSMALFLIGELCLTIFRVRP